METLTLQNKNTGNLFKLSLILFAFSVFSCETTEKIDDFPLRPSKLVLNCYFNPDSTWKFQVSKSLSVLDNANLKLIDNATLLLFEEDIFLDSILNPDEDGFYRFAMLPKPGKNYIIEVTSPDYQEKLSASDGLPVPVPITKTKVSIIDSSFYGDIYYSYGYLSGNFEISLNDPGENINYYQFKVYSYDSVFNYIEEIPEFEHLVKRSLLVSSDDPVLSSHNNYNNQLLFEDRMFNGKEISLRINFEDFNPRRGKKYYLELLSLSRAGYLYRKTIDEYEMARNDPFAEPVMIYSNIQNGFGIFSGYSSHIDSIVPF